METFIKNLANSIIQGKDIKFEQALKLLEIKEKDLETICTFAEKILKHFRGSKVNLCSLINAKSGNCSEDCAFCAQSSLHNTNVPTYPLIPPEEMLRRAENIYDRTKTHRICIVISGCALNNDELELICQGIRLIKNRFPTLKLDASLGQLTYEQAKRLKHAGLSRYNHNLETVEEYFANICSTHTFLQRLKTIQNLKRVGLEVCCGGIFGLGETQKQRIELGFILKELDVNCIPINFLNPIPGTRLENNSPVEPGELLKMVAIFRFINPTKEIKICGGREESLGNSQALIFKAGADSIIIGGYLTTSGRPAEKDLEMIKTLGLEV